MILYFISVFSFVFSVRLILLYNTAQPSGKINYHKHDIKHYFMLKCRSMPLSLCLSEALPADEFEFVCFKASLVRN